MIEASVYEAKTRLSELLQAVARGEAVTITNRNRPVARLVPVDPPRQRPVFGSARPAMRAMGLDDPDVARATGRDRP